MAFMPTRTSITVTTSLPRATEPPGGSRRLGAFLAIGGPSDTRVSGLRDEWLGFLSIGLLIASAADPTPVGGMLRLAWLGSMVVLVPINAGAALGSAIAGVAVFATQLSGAGLMPWNRPDNYALLALLGGLVLRVIRQRRPLTLGWTVALVGGFVVYGLVHSEYMGVLDRANFDWYMRMFGLPMLLFLLLAQVRFEAREIRALVRSLLVLGVWMGVTSILEQLHLYSVIIPAWIGDRGLNAAFGTGRSGGLLMQSEWNGMALSLIYCLGLFSLRFDAARGRMLPLAAVALCVAGTFLSFTRAAWLGMAVASAVLFLIPGTRGARSRIRRAGIAIGGAAVVALGVVASRTAGDRVNDSGTMYFRLNLWSAALEMSRARPILGYGFGTFGEYVGDYQDAMLFDQGPTHITEGPVHNTTLSVLVELGGIGLILYASGMALLYRDTHRRAAQIWGREGWLWVASFAATYLIQAQFAIAHEPTTNLIFFGMMGAVAGAGGLPRMAASPETGAAHIPVAA